MDISKIFAVLVLFLRITFGLGACIQTPIEKCIAQIGCTNDLQSLSRLTTLPSCGHNEQRCSNYRYYDCRNEFKSDTVLLHINLKDIDIETSDLGLDSSTLRNIVTFSIDNGEDIPEIVFEFSKLEELAITDSSVTAIALNQFTQLGQLVKLNVSYNYISDLVIFLSPTVSGVTTIDFSHNRIKTIPNNYFVLFPMLHYLDLSHNELTNFDILTFEGILQLTALDVSYNQIKEVGHAFARFINLITLNLAFNNLSSIIEPNFKTMEKLVLLNLNDNQIIEIEDNAFHSLSNLVILNLNNNRLSKITKTMLQGNPNLIKLYIENNNISQIESEAFKANKITAFKFKNNNLKGVLLSNTFDGIITDELDLSGGEVTGLGAEAFSGLHVKFLNLSNNSINNTANTSFKSVVGLTKLDLSNNKLQNIIFDTSDLKQLEILIASDNYIQNVTKIFFDNLTSLLKLDLSFNKIQDLGPQIFKSLIKLEHLDVSNNKYLNTLNGDVFQGLNSVKSINLTQTRISTLMNNTLSGLRFLDFFNISRGELSVIEYNAFKNANFKKLDLSFNLLEDFFVNTTSFNQTEEIYLNNNRLRNITKESFSGCVNLLYLNLSDNNIMNMDSHVLTYTKILKFLDLSSNPLQTTNIFENSTSLHLVKLANIKNQINFKHLSNISIKILDMSGNDYENISSLFIYKIDKLNKLDLSMNKITIIDKFCFQNLPELEWLDLSFNSISFIQPGSFLHTGNVQDLNLFNNLLPYIEYGALDGLQSLTTLNLSNNVLTEFNKNILHSIPLMTSLALDDNIIQNMEFAAFERTNVKKISIGGNMITCDAFAELNARNYNFTITAANLDFHSANVNGIRCKSNSNANKKYIWSVNTTDDKTTNAFLAFNNAIDNLRDSMTKALSNFSSSINDEKRFESDNVTNILRDILKTNEDMFKYVNNRTQQTVANKEFDELIQQFTQTIKQIDNTERVTNTQITELIKQMIITNNRTVSLITNIKRFLNESRTGIDGDVIKYSNTSDVKFVDHHMEEKIKLLNAEKDKIVDEIRTIFENMKNADSPVYHEALTKETNEMNDVRALLYVITICLALAVVMYVSKFIYGFWKRNNNLSYRNNRMNTSSQPLSSSLEMHVS